MKKNALAAALSALLLALPLAACEQIGWSEQDQTPPFPVTAENVTVEKAPRAVGSLSPSLTKLLLDLGYRDRIVGYANDDEIPQGVKLDDLSALLTEVLPDAPAAGEESGSSADSAEESGASAPGQKSGPANSAAPQSPAESAGSVGSADAANSAASASAAASGSSAAPAESDASAAISIPEDWDGKTPLPKEPVYIGRMGTALAPDMNAIGILKPELIFTTLPMTKEEMDRLDAVHIKVVVMPPVTTLDGLYARILDVVALMDGQLARDAAEQGLVEPVKAQLDYIQSKLPAQKQSFLYFTENGHIAATGDTWESAVLSLVGDNLAAGQTDYTLTDDELAGMNPDVLLYSAPVDRANLVQDPKLADKTAVKSGSLVELDRAALMTQTRAVVETVRTIARQLYPGVDFSEPPPPSSAAAGSGAK